MKHCGGGGGGGELELAQWLVVKGWLMTREHSVETLLEMPRHVQMDPSCSWPQRCVAVATIRQKR